MKEKNKSKKGKKIRLGGFLIIIFLMLYIPSLVHFIYGKSIRTDLIYMGVIEDSISTDAYIIRDETLLRAPFDGTYIPEVLEGEKVPANFRVATVLKDSSSKLLEDLANINLRIIETQKNRSKNVEFFSEDLIKLDTEIGKRTHIIIDAINNNYFSNIEKAERDINELIEKKITIMGANAPSDDYINSLNSEKERLNQKVKENTAEVITELSGIISFSADGYEEMLNTSAIESLTPKVLENIKTANVKKDPSDKRVEAEKPFARIIKNYDYIIAASIESNKAQVYKTGDLIQRIRINDIDKVVNGVVTHVSDDIEGRCIVAVKVDKAISETASLRKINVDLIRNSFEGLKVPLSSLMNIDIQKGTASIAIVKANYVRIKDVEIVGANKDFAIIKGLESQNDSGVSLYDTYIVHPVNIREGQVIE